MTRSSAREYRTLGPFALGRDQLTLPQHLEVPGDGGLRHVQRLGQLVHVHGSVVERVEHEDPLGVGETLTDAGVQKADLPLQRLVHALRPRLPDSLLTPTT